MSNELIPKHVGLFCSNFKQNTVFSKIKNKVLQSIYDFLIS